MDNIIHWSMYDYSNLIDYKAVDKKYNPVTHEITTYSRFIITVDTETSKRTKNTFKNVKKGHRTVKEWSTDLNYLVAFSITVRYEHDNIVTLYGSDPYDCAKCIKTLRDVIVGNKVLMFIYNESYDWTFLRKFLIREMGEPDKQLNIESHYPISIEFGRLIIRDALILANRKLEKWAEDLDVEHKKAVGFWDYDKIRPQNDDQNFTPEEIRYICNDTMACCECIDKLLQTMNCKLKDIPFTSTGIARRDAYKIGRKHKAKLLYNRLVLSKEEYLKFEKAFHGGFTHCNRFTGGRIFNNVICYDFTSSYPFVVCSEKFPMTKFIRLNGYFSVKDILSTNNKYAYLLKLTMVNVELRDKNEQMPVLQNSKDISGTSDKEKALDNGRVLSSPLYECYCTDIDLELINRQYKAQYKVVSEVYRAEYDYLPRWFTDHVYSIFEDKCKLKGGDPVLYDITKMKLNSVAYGMLAMHNIKEQIIEDYDSGEYKTEHGDTDEIYKKFTENRKNIYPYQWSLWVTSYAMKNLHELGACCDTWLYCDTDSCFSNSWHLDKVEDYNNKATAKLSANGYEPITVNGKTFYLGRATLDKECDEFKALHSKCYAYKKEGEIYITVAGVPKKKGRKVLKSLDDFEEGFIFDGRETGKLTHVYHYLDQITEEDNIIFGDSIDLIPCDYQIGGVRIDDIIDNGYTAEEVVNSMFVKSVYSSARSYD